MFYFQQLHFPDKSKKIHKFKFYIELEKELQTKSVNLCNFTPILAATDNKGAETKYNINIYGCTVEPH